MGGRINKRRSEFNQMMKQKNKQKICRISIFIREGTLSSPVFYFTSVFRHLSCEIFSRV